MQRLGSPTALAFQQAFLKLGMLRIWALIKASTPGARIVSAYVDDSGCLFFYHGRSLTQSIMEISSGRLLTRAEKTATGLILIPEFLWTQENPLSAARFSALDIMQEQDDHVHRFPCGMEPCILSHHARMDLLDSILEGYRGVGLPDPDLSLV